VYGTFERRDVVLHVFALSPKLVLCPRDRGVAASLDERAHGSFHLLRFCLAGDRPGHGEQCRVPASDPLLVRYSYLELDARILVKVV
jgi:hypothetical protein